PHLPPPSLHDALPIYARRASMTAVVPAAAEAPARDRRSPYQGLVPYGEADAEWFFGRAEWREIVIDNLRAYRVSVLYGESGVGKDRKSTRLNSSHLGI